MCLWLVKAMYCWKLLILATVLLDGIHCETFEVHRSSCRRDALFKAADRDKKLTGISSNLIFSGHAASLSLCAHKCTSTPPCMTFNYKKKPSSSQDLNCQLLDINRSNSKASLQSSVGWIHYQPVTQVSCLSMFSLLVMILFRISSKLS